MKTLVTVPRMCATACAEAGAAVGMALGCTEPSGTVSARNGSGPVIATSFKGVERCLLGEERLPFWGRLEWEQAFFNGRSRRKRVTAPLLVKWLWMPNGWLESNSPKRSAKPLSMLLNGHERKQTGFVRLKSAIRCFPG